VKKVRRPSEDEMRSEYRPEDLGEGVRGKYYKEYIKGTNFVLLSPDAAATCPRADAINEALPRGGSDGK